MNQKVIAPIVYGIMWASSYTTAQTRLSQLRVEEFPTYIVIEMDQIRDLLGNHWVNVKNDKHSIYKKQLDNLESVIKESKANCTPTDLLNEMDSFGYAVDDVYTDDNEGSISDKTGFIFKKKSNALQEVEQKKSPK